MNTGTAGSVAPLFYVPWVTVTESEASKRGRTLFSESGMPVATLGEKRNEATANFQCADVMRSRCEISEVIDEGNHSVLGAAGGFIEITTGARIHIRRQSDADALDMIVHVRPEETSVLSLRRVVVRVRTVQLTSSQDCVMMFFVVASESRSTRNRKIMSRQRLTSRRLVMHCGGTCQDVSVQKQFINIAQLIFASWNGVFSHVL